MLEALSDGTFHRFESLFNVEEGRLGIVVTFLSLLTLAKEQLIEIMQDAPNPPGGDAPHLAPIYVKSLASADTPADIPAIERFNERLRAVGTEYRFPCRPADLMPQGPGVGPIVAGTAARKKDSCR